MKVEDQVVSLPLAKRLKELGLPQDSYLYWRKKYHTSANVKWNENDLQHLDETEYAAFTVAELGEMLPMIYIPVHDGKKGWLWSYDGSRNYETTEADARAKMLICLIEAGEVKV